MSGPTLTQIYDRALNDHLQGDPESPRYYIDPQGFVRDRDHGCRFASYKAYEREQEQIEHDLNEASRPIWED